MRLLSKNGDDHGSRHNFIQRIWNISMIEEIINHKYIVSNIDEYRVDLNWGYSPKVFMDDVKGYLL